MNELYLKIRPYLTVRNILGVAIIVGIFTVISMIDSCKDRKYRAQYESQFDSLTLANQQLVTLKNKAEQEVKRQTAIVTDNQKQLMEKAKELFNLEKQDQKHIGEIKALISMKNTVRVDSVKVPYTDVAARKRFSDSLEAACAEVITFYQNSTVPVGQKASLDSSQNKDLQVDATILKNGIMIDSAVLPDNQYIAIYESKSGLLRRDINGKLHFWTKPSMEVQVTHTNKYIKVTGMNSLYYQPKVKGRWLERLLLVAAGAAATVLIVK